MNAAPRPVAARSSAEQRSVTVVFSALMLAMLLGALDQTIVSTALPTIVGDLGGLTELTWVVTAYILASTITTPLYGKIGDIYGRKRIFQGSIAVFLVGSMLCGLSQNMAELIAFRGLQGIGAGGLMVGSQAIIGDIVSPRERGRYMGYFGGAFAVATVAGPLLGGFFVDHASWRWVFYVNVPVGALALAMTQVALHVPSTRRAHRIDVLGAGLLAAGVAAIVLMVTWGGTEYPWASWQTLALGAGGAGLLAAFAAAERVAAEPILPLWLFRNSVFTLVNVVGFIVGLAMFGSIIFLPQYLQIVKGDSATASGLQLVPMMLGMLITLTVSGQLISRTGRYRYWPIAGTAVMAVGMYLLSSMGPSTPGALTAIYMVVVGLGIGGVMQVLVLLAQNSVSQRDLGTATSTATFFRSMGGSIGLPIFGAIFSNVLSGNLARVALPAAVRAGLSSGSGNASPKALAALPPQLHATVVGAFSQSLGTVFMAGIPFALVAFALVWLIREVPLRTRNAAADETAGEAPAAGSGPAGKAGERETVALSA